MITGKFTDNEKSDIRTMFKNGSNIKEIALKLNRKRDTIYTEVRRHPERYGSDIVKRKYNSKKSKALDLIDIPSFEVCFNLKSIYRNFLQSDIDNIVILSEKEKKKIEEIKNKKLNKSLKGFTNI